MATRRIAIGIYITVGRPISYAQKKQWSCSLYLLTVLLEVEDCSTWPSAQCIALQKSRPRRLRLPADHTYVLSSYAISAGLLCRPMGMLRKKATSLSVCEAMMSLDSRFTYSLSHARTPLR